MFNYFCHGGPWHGATLLLASPTTLVFTVGGVVGRYRGGSVHYTNHTGKQVLLAVPLDVHYGHDLIWEKADV